MKRIVLALAAAFALAACSTAPTQGAEPENTAVQPAAVPQDAGEPRPEAEPLHEIASCWTASVGENAAYSAINLNNSGIYVATSLDFATGQQEVLCTKSGCPHTDDTCPAFLWSMGEDYCVAYSAMLADGDKLYWVVDGRYNESAGAYVDVSDPDGRNRRRIAEGEELPDLSWAMDEHGWMAGTDALYWYGWLDAKAALLKISEAEGVELLWTAPEDDAAQGKKDYVDWYPVNYWPLGCWQGKMLLRQTGGYDLSSLPDNAMENLEEYLAADEALAAANQEQLMTLDSDGSLVPLGITWKGGDTQNSVLCKGILYQLEPDGTLTGTDLLTGQCLPVDVPLEAPLQYINSKAGRLWLNEVYVFDPESGEITELQATWFKDMVAPRVPFVVAYSDTMLLLLVGEEYYTATSLDKDGTPFSHTASDNQYGLIPAAEFFSGSQDWVEVTLLGRDLI